LHFWVFYDILYLLNEKYAFLAYLSQIIYFFGNSPKLSLVFILHIQIDLYYSSAISLKGGDFLRHIFHLKFYSKGDFYFESIK